MTNADAAVAMITDGMTVGLGSGAASTRFIRTLGDKVRAGTLKIRGVPTSAGSAALANEVGIPLVELADGMPIDITVDGADEFDPRLNMIKGYGKALVREKIVAVASKKVVILVGPDKVAEKRVAVLGKRGSLPVEVVPFALPLVRKKLADMGMPADVLMDGGVPFVSDNGNHIVHAKVTAITNPAATDAAIRGIPGVVDTGLFVGIADLILVEDGGKVEELRRS